MNREGIPKSLVKNLEHGRDRSLELLSLSDLENHKKIVEESIQTSRHIMEGIQNDEQVRAYYERHTLSEEEELAKIDREIIKRKI